MILLPDHSILTLMNFIGMIKSNKWLFRIWMYKLIVVKNREINAQHMTYINVRKILGKRKLISYKWIFETIYNILKWIRAESFHQISSLFLSPWLNTSEYTLTKDYCINTYFSTYQAGFSYKFIVWLLSLSILWFWIAPNLFANLLVLW